MKEQKTVRSLCCFTNTPQPDLQDTLKSLASRIENAGFAVQTQRICSPTNDIGKLDSVFPDPSLYLSVGRLDRKEAAGQMDAFLRARNVSFHLPLDDRVIPEDVDLLFRIIRKCPSKTFSFAYTFHNAPSSPFFPSAAYERDGFSVGLQPTDLAEGCGSVHEWMKRMRDVWEELAVLFGDRSDFLGIDSSVASLFSGGSSLIHHMRRWFGSFSGSVNRSVYLEITDFLKSENPKPVGLCGLMFPCLEDFELAEEYEAGNFPVERNIYLSLHSGLGIDTYPVGIDEPAGNIADALEMLLRFSQKYGKPLSARFVSDGKTRTGEKTDFKNPYLKDVRIRPLGGSETSR